MVWPDVEEAEMNGLRGMRNTLIKYHPRRIICETTLDGEVTRFLVECGYSPSPLEYIFLINNGET